MDCVIDERKALDLTYYKLGVVPESEQFTSVVRPLVKHGFVPEHACRQFIELNAGKQRAITQAPSVANGVSAEVITSYRNDEAVQGAQYDALNPYMNWQTISAAVNEHWGTSFNLGIIPEVGRQYSIYFKGQYCNVHHDVIIRNKQLIRASRRLTVLLYLNPWHHEEGKAGTFAGGTLLFPSIIDCYGQPFQVQPKAGTLVIFPSNPKYVHLVSEVTYGERHTIVMFGEIVR